MLWIRLPCFVVKSCFVLISGVQSLSRLIFCVVKSCFVLTSGLNISVIFLMFLFSCSFKGFFVVVFVFVFLIGLSFLVGGRSMVIVFLFVSVFTTSCISFLNGGSIISSWSNRADDSEDCSSITSFLDGGSPLLSFLRGHFFFRARGAVKIIIFFHGGWGNFRRFQVGSDLWLNCI